MTIQGIPRRLPEVGRLRLGQKVNGTRPAALAAWRLTSKSRFRLDAAAQVYGGTVREWADAPGEDTQWELYTESKALRVAIIPHQPVSQFYEHWTGGGCQRRCDGATELISGDPCLCRMESDEASDYRCRPTTRLSVLLPDLPGLGVWRVETHGYYGAAELAASAELLASFGRPMPVALVIDQRSEKRPGQPRRDYVVPMLDSRQSFLDLQALALADPVTGEVVAPQRPALEQSGAGLSDASDTAEDPVSSSPVPDPTSEMARGGARTTDILAGASGTATPGPPSPSAPKQEEPSGVARSGAEGANHDSKPGAGPSPPDATRPPDGSPPPGRPSGGTKRSRPAVSPGKAAAGRADPEQLDLAAFEQGQADERDPGQWTR